MMNKINIFYIIFVISNDFKPRLRCYCEKKYMSYELFESTRRSRNKQYYIIKYRNTELRKIIHNTFINMFETLGVLVIFLLRGP